MAQMPKAPIGYIDIMGLEPQPGLRTATVGFAQGVAGGFENDQARVFWPLRKAVPTRRAYSNSMPNSGERTMPDNSESTKFWRVGAGLRPPARRRRILRDDLAG